jgi:hypothetical protein
MSPPDLHPWFLILVQRLLEGEKRILRLFGHDPFPGAPPKFIRADWYRYHFTKRGERGWWTRTFVGQYLPAVQLRDESRDHAKSQNEKSGMRHSQRSESDG